MAAAELDESAAGPRCSAARSLLAYGEGIIDLPQRDLPGIPLRRRGIKEERERECVKSASKSPLREKGEVFSVPHTKNVFFRKKLGKRTKTDYVLNCTECVLQERDVLVHLSTEKWTIFTRLCEKTGHELESFDIRYL